MSMMEDLQLASQVIQQADDWVIAAGAGMGVDSGLPDFRGREGFWQTYPALAKAKLENIAKPTIAKPSTNINHARRLKITAKNDKLRKNYFGELIDADIALGLGE